MSSNKLEMCSLSLFTILTLIFQPFLDIRTQQKLQPLAFIIAVLEGKKCSLSSYILLEFPSPSSIRSTLDILFSSNHNIHKSSSGLWFWASDTLNRKILLKSIDLGVWSPKTMARRTFMNVVIWRKKYI